MKEEVAHMADHGYEPPTLFVEGRLGDLTGGNSQPVTSLDQAYPAGTPFYQLTWASS